MGVTVSAQFHIYALCFACKIFIELDNGSKYLTPQWLDFRTKHPNHRVDMAFRTPRGPEWKFHRALIVGGR